MELYRPQSEFPFLKEYKEKFTVTGDTIFAYKKQIFTNEKKLPPDILVHELKHLDRQNKIGAEIWIDNYLNDDRFRLREEVLAFNAQLAVYKDRNDRNLCKLRCVKSLSEDYRLDIEPLEAFKLLN